MCPNFDVWYQIKPNRQNISRAVFIDLWLCLFTTKLSYTQLFKWGHYLSRWYVHIYFRNWNRISDCQTLTISIFFIVQMNFIWECVNFLGSASNMSPRRQMFQPKSLYISRAVRHFYETEYEIWAGLGPVDSTENFNLGHKVCYFWRQFCYVFMGKKDIKKFKKYSH